MERPLISVVMPTFNEPEKLVSQAIQSILDQTIENFELLILDDSERPETRLAIDSFRQDPRVQIIRGENRLGFIRALNRGLEMAKGQWIARMDGDDISLPQRFEKELAYLQAHPDISVVGGQINIIDGNGRITSSRAYPVAPWKLWLYSCFRNPLAHPTVMMRRDIVDQGFRYDESLKTAEDLDFWLRLMNRSFKLRNLEDTLLDYRVLDSFVDKRSGQIEQSARVRKKNFDKRHLCHSVLSVCAGWMFRTAPLGAIKKLYHRENKQ